MDCVPHVRLTAIALTAWAFAGVRAESEPDPSLQSAVERDWERQEERRGRRPEDPEAVAEALERYGHLLEALRTEHPGLDLADASTSLDALRERLEGKPGSPETRRALYFEVRRLARKVVLRNPLIASRPIAFLKRNRFTCQMLHEYLGYFYDYADIAGGGVHVLDEPGLSLRTRDLIRSRLPDGNYTTLAVSFDASTIFFAFSPRASSKTDFYGASRRCFHVYSVTVDGGELRQLTEGPEDDFDPCPLPDGGIAFMSTRRGGFGRCHNPWEPLPSYTLHRMDADGRNVRTLSFHETNEWHPSVLHDGRIVYTRWDYVDRSAANFHGLWISNPDGSNPSSLFGNYTERINACYQPRAVPGSDKVVFVAGAHHAAVGGSLVLVDTGRVDLAPQTGEDDFKAVESVTPEVCFPEAPGWPKSYFHSPWPLSEDFFLVSFSFDPLPGMGPGVERDTETGLYLMDRFGNLELLFRENGVSSMYPVPLAARPSPPKLASALDESFGDEGELFVLDVRRSFFPLPADRDVRELRVFQVLPKSRTHVANQPRLGYANAESARMLLGTVPVEPDGSAYFRVPARKPLYFQAVDGQGKAVQGMRSVTYVQPGERRGCVGCHEPRHSTPPSVRPLALRRPPSRLVPGPDGSRPWSFPRLVQTVLDEYCIRCHGGENPVEPALTGESAGTFSRSYEALKPTVRWYEWGNAGIPGFVTRPGSMPADTSLLARILQDELHSREVDLKEADRRRLWLWLDGNASFFGTYTDSERLAQSRGEAVPPPSLQ